MPTRKQRKRREKESRHEYEYVEVDPETGEERTVDPAELRAERPAKDRKTTAQQRGKQQRSRRTARVPQPASWRRVVKRTAIFAPLMALFIYWTQSSSKTGISGAGIVLNTVILIAFFAPFSYLVDSMTYRFYVKRTGGQPPRR
jgi:hypothetical protein